MSIVLAIDTSTDVCAGVGIDGQLVGEGRVSDRRAHVEQLMPLISRVVTEAGIALVQVDEIVVGLGPGPFTGLRVGVATADVLGATLGVPVRGVCSLDAVAAQWVAEARLGLAPAPVGDFLVTADARRREVYWAQYDALGIRVDGPFVSAPDVLPRLPVSGPGATLIPQARMAGPSMLDAGWLARVGSTLPDMGREPLYLRRPDAHEPTTRKSTLLHTRLDLGGKP